ncbi:serine/threonine protein kinase [Erythrobacter sp. NFXS35]|uniref:serine/threonine-protein kinase n=1 Tax=Erythrobacter sp. NFXS35 TaxID=2818436 RepID=UPI0032DE8746
MTFDDMAVLQKAFDKARILSGGEYDTFLFRFAQTHPDLSADLKSILAADKDSDRTMADLVEASVKEVFDEREIVATGEKVGAWSIRRRLGKGGMGAVFLVERDDGAYHQTAALKLATMRLLGSEAHSRFRAERQILASLRHPNIATLIDGGMHEGGAPYLVMEYIEGQQIDAHCNALAMSIDQRLEIFCSVCDAVDFAHRSLVVHRDLKPSNILVTPDGQAKLLDFGIAKLLETSNLDVTILETQGESRAMTPLYASPEQVRGEAVTVETDVYALGVLLYRLLAGRSPYGEAIMISREIENAILDADPIRPSVSVTNVPPNADSLSADELAKQRGVNAAELRSKLKGDLDNIVLQCLQKEPERRYPSARDLARDIERYLRHEPISARGDDILYRARKFARRNARTLMAGSVAVLALLSGAALYTVQLAAERDRTALAAERADQVSQFMVEIFAGADPNAAPGETVTAIELLEQGTQRIDQIGDRTVKAELLRAMGKSFQALGQYPRSEELLKQSVALLREAETADPMQLAFSLTALGYVQHDQYKTGEAIANTREALDIARLTLPPDSPELSRFVAELGRAYNIDGQPDKALALFAQAIDLQRGSGTYGTEMTADLLGGLSVGYIADGQYQRGLEISREEQRLMERLFGPNDVGTIHAVARLGWANSFLGNYDEALAHTNDAIERGELLWGADHPDLAMFRASRGEYAARMGDFASSQASFDRGMENVLATSGRGSSDHVGHLLMRGRSALESGLVRQGRRFHDEGLALALDLFGEDGSLTLSHRQGVAKAARMAGDLDTAKAHMAQVWRFRERLRRPLKLAARSERALLMMESGDLAGAEANLRGVLEETEAAVGENSPSLIETLIALSQVNRLGSEPQSALAFARTAQDIAQSRLPDDSWIAAVAFAEYGHVLIDLGRTKEGTRVLRNAIADLQAVFEEDNYHLRKAREGLQSASSNLAI